MQIMQRTNGQTDMVASSKRAQISKQLCKFVQDGEFAALQHKFADAIKIVMMPSNCGITYGIFKGCVGILFFCRMKSW